MNIPVKRVIIFVVAVIAVAGIAMVAVSLWNNASSGNIQENANVSTSSIAAATIPCHPPTGNMFTLGTPSGNVTVNNFYNIAQSVSTDHTSILIVQTSTYNITYYIPDSSFNLLITTAPFLAARQEAETELLQILGVSRGDACKLSVRESTMPGVDAAYSGSGYGLSFCPSGR